MPLVMALAGVTVAATVQWARGRLASR
jgi:hypothetical protein